MFTKSIKLHIQVLFLPFSFVSFLSTDFLLFFTSYFRLCNSFARKAEITFFFFFSMRNDLLAKININSISIRVYAVAKAIFERESVKYKIRLFFVCQKQKDKTKTRLHCSNVTDSHLKQFLFTPKTQKFIYIPP